MRGRFLVLLGAIALLVGLTGPVAGAAESDYGYTAAPASGPVGTKISVASTTPCPTPASPTLTTVELALIDAGGHRDAGSNTVTPAANGSWSTSITVAGGARNGMYRILVLCEYGTAEGSPFVFYAPAREFGVTSAAGQPDPAIRLAANDRVGTAIAASKDLVPEEGDADDVVLSRSDSYADALAGTPLAELLQAPLLLTSQSSLDAQTQAEIQRVLTPGGNVHILGGTAAVSDAVATKITTLGFKVIRYAGTNRYDTAVKIASIGITDPQTVLLATGTDFRDGLVAGVAAPFASDEGPGVVLLTNGNTMPPETQAYLASLGAIPKFAVGAPAAAAAPTAVALVGTDYSDTSRKVADRFFTTPAGAAIATTGSFADALAGGAHAAAYEVPLLLTPSTSLHGSVSSYLAAHKTTEMIGFVYGGTAAVAENVRAAFAQSIT